MSTDDVRIEPHGKALWVTINREARRNAMNSTVLDGIAEALAIAEASPTFRCLVLTGSGEKAFCAGADLSQGTSTFDGRFDEPTTDFGRLARKLRHSGLPLIARVNGACVAGGMALMAMCDLAIAADHARFGLPEVKVGVFPMQVLVYLRHKLHACHINELCLTGELISAQRAAEIGLINEVCPAADLDARLEAWVQRLAAASPTATRRGKLAIAAMQTMSFEQALPFAEAQIALAAASNDAAEGIAAFNEKRPPTWLQTDKT